MKGALRKFLVDWVGQRIKDSSLSRGAPTLRTIFEHRRALDRTLKPIHPDLADGESACVFLYEVLSNEIKSRYSEEYLLNLEGKALDTDADGIESIAQAVVDYLESIPRPTLALVPIESIQANLTGYGDLGNGFCLLKSPVEPAAIDSVPQFLRSLVVARPPMAQYMPPSQSTISPGVYLGRYAQGIPTFLAGRETFNRSFDDIKVWIGIGRRLTHFQSDDHAGLLAIRRSLESNYAYLIDVDRASCASVQLSLDESSFVSKLTLKILNGNIDAYAKALNMTVAPFFEGEELRPAAVAYQWLVDSLATVNDTNSFLYCCIGLEAALGEEGADESTTTLLSERCAYLLGETNTQRSKLRSDFRRIYKMRSKLVHGRERRIPGLIGSTLLEARSLLEQVAFAEWSKVIKQNAIAEKAKSKA